MNCMVTLKTYPGGQRARSGRTCGNETDLAGLSLYDTRRRFPICRRCLGRVKSRGNHISPITLGLVEVRNLKTGEVVY